MLCALHTSKVGGSGGRASNPWLIFCWLAVCSRLPCHALTPSLAGGARFLGASAGRLLVVKVLASLNPSADVMALASLEVDIGNLAEGNCMIVKWRGKPVFVRSRTEDEIEQATSVGMGELRDPESDEDRAQKPGTLVVIGVCTRTRGARALKTASRSPRSPLRFTLTPLFFPSHGCAPTRLIGSLPPLAADLGCVPINGAGDFGGWFCPCHGSHYDTSGRIRKGPAPLNLEVPPYSFVDDTKILVG